MGVHQPLSTRERVARHRADMRAKGLRLKQIWVRDVKSDAFKAEARRQSLLISQCERDADEMAFIESLLDLNDWSDWRND
jgi:Protein  of unknown function (DUF3018)